MSLWFQLWVSAQRLDTYMEIQRQQDLDLSDPASADTVNDYEVRIDDRVIGTVQHRYGDGAWMLIRKAVNLEGIPSGMVNSPAKRLGG